jgi:hypothetical protein
VPATNLVVIIAVLIALIIPMVWFLNLMFGKGDNDE